LNRRTVNGALLGVPEAAAYLGGSERWLRRLLDRGLVPCKRIGRNLYFKRTELDEFIDDLPGVTVAQARRAVNARKQATGWNVGTPPMFSKDAPGRVRQ